MKPSIDRTIASNALDSMKTACRRLSDVRPSVAIEPEEFCEIVRITKELKALTESLEVLLKGGAV